MVKELLFKDVNYICFRLDRILLVLVILILVLGNIYMLVLNVFCVVFMVFFLKLWIDEFVLFLVIRVFSLFCIVNK